jgi:hypothetical protein
MNKSVLVLVFAVILTVSFGINSAFAVSSLEISTSKKTYEYGDYLSINILVPDLSSKTVTLHITDSSNKTSAPINLPIAQTNTTITTPVPFYKINFDPGTYRIDAQYSNFTTSTSFDIIDSGKIAIPVELKSLVKTLEQGDQADSAYTSLIRELVNDKIIDIPNYAQSNQPHIPQWFKNNFKWWADSSISDNDFGMAIKYLVQKGIISA